MNRLVFRAPESGPRGRPLLRGGLIVPPGMLAVQKASYAERAANAAARERVAAALERDLAEVLVSFQEGITAAQAEAAVVSGNVRVILNAAAPNQLEAQLVATVSEHLEAALEEGVHIGARFSPPALEGISVNLAQEAALAHIQTQAASSVLGITQATEAGIRQALTLQITDAISPTEAARRVGDLAGLNDRQVRAVANYREALTKRLAPVPEALTPSVQAVIDQDVALYQRRQLMLRGRTIAENEVQAAITHGENAIYDEAVAEGIVEADVLTKTWNTVFDSRVCPICLPLHLVTIQRDEIFSGGFMGPPAHPRCRCFLEYATDALRGGGAPLEVSFEPL